jgi:hypothetical protein
MLCAGRSLFFLIPLLALTFVLAPLPNTLFAHCGGDDFSLSSHDSTSGAVDLGRFLTSIIVVTGFALPVVLTHSEVVRPGACVMSIIGGAYVRFDCTRFRAHSCGWIGWCTELYWHIQQCSERTTNMTEYLYVYAGKSHYMDLLFNITRKEVFELIQRKLWCYGRICKYCSRCIDYSEELSQVLTRPLRY